MGSDRGRNGVSKFDRYLLSRLLAIFGFFSLVLVLVYWLNSAVGLFDRLIGDGQSALVFLEISLLTLPNVIRIVLPVAAFAASVYVANRLTQDQELVVMQATGFSAFRLARPVLYFGLIVGAMVFVLHNFVVPQSRNAFAVRTAEIGANLTSQLLVDGQFMHPSDGITFYIADLSDNGGMTDVFLSDDRGLASRTIYTSKRALLAQDAAGPKIVMFDGLRQTLSKKDERLSITHFADFTYDIGALMTAAVASGRSVDGLSTAELLHPTEATMAETGADRAAFLADGNSRIAGALLTPSIAVIGFAALLLGAFSRFGLWRQIVGAVVVLILVQMVDNAATSAALRDVRAWPLIYVAPLIAAGAAAGFLWLAQRPRRVGTSGLAPA